MSVDPVPRDPGHYHPTTHAKQQRRHRNIAWDFVSEVLASGDVRPSPKEDCRLFVKRFEGHGPPVGVVANVETGEIVTVEWRRD